MARPRVTVGAWPGWHARVDWASESGSIQAAEAGAIAAALRDGGTSGHCALCDRATSFALGGGASPMREGLTCAHCGCNARQRAAAMVLASALPDIATARVYATEHASPFYIALRRRSGQLIGSEFGTSLQQRLRLSSWLWRHGAPGWIRSEDVTALKMRDASLDGVISLDVLEHVPDYRQALREFARVLRPGGALVLTVPWYEHAEASEPIARLASNGESEHLGEPEFHGDPLSGGVLCFHHFGWDLLADMRAAGFSDVTACRVQSLADGLPQGLWVLRARR